MRSLRESFRATGKRDARRRGKAPMGETSRSEKPRRTADDALLVVAHEDPQ